MNVFFFLFFVSVLFLVLVSGWSNGFWQFDVVQSIAIIIFLMLKLLWCGWWESFLSWLLIHFVMTLVVQETFWVSGTRSCSGISCTFSAQTLKQHFLQGTLAAFNGKCYLVITIRVLAVLTISGWDSISRIFQWI